MAKLKCDKHKLRVLTVNGKFVHRTGWGTVCDSPTATIGDFTGTAREIETGGRDENRAKKQADG